MSCLTEQDFTKEVTIKLRNFGMKQQALARELLEAKHLGICKISTSTKEVSAFKSLALMLESGSVSMKIDIILTNSNTKEI